MPNMTIVAIYVPFAVITAIVFSIELLRRFKRHEDYLFSILCFIVLCWFICNIAGMLANSVALAKFFMNFILVFVGFIPPILLLFILKFYRVHLKHLTKVTILMLIIPTINIIMTLTADFHALMNERLSILSLSPFREVVLVWGPWFWVHTIHSYMISLLIIAVLFFQHFRMPKFYRLPSTMMVIGVALTLSGNIITLMQLLPVALDPTLITISLSLIFFSLAIINNNKSKFARFSRGQLFHYLDEYILVLDENHRVTDYNRPALDWFSSQAISLNSTTLEMIKEAFLCKGNVVIKDFEDEKSADIYFSGAALPVVLNLRIREMADAKGDVIGSIAIFTDVTQNRMLLERLEAKAGMDSLTGLANRTAYKGAKSRLDDAERLPLSVIMCDANGLKHVNDTLGHQYGDMMLRVIAEVLESECPPSGFVARIGGDEFIYLLPLAHPDAAIALMEQVRESLSRRENLPFTASVALGTATKYSEDQSLDDVIALADTRMYEDKKRIKERSSI